jgi:hypothetical protein
VKRAIIVALGLVTARTGTTAPAEPGFATATIRFGDDLGTGDVRLSGAGDSRRIAFACEAAWKIMPASQLHLLLEHSPQLDPDRSFLSVTLNGGIVRSLRLDETNQALTDIVIPLPPAMLRGSNELVLSAVQYGRSGTPDAEVWSLIRASSLVSLAYEGQQGGPSLDKLPLPLLDPASYRPHVLSVALPVQPSPETLEATALVVGFLAMRLAPRPLRLSFVRSAETDRPLLAVGTPAEQPQLMDRLKGSKVRLEPAVGMVGVAGGSGVPPLLFVTGEAPSAVLRAARALAGNDSDLKGPWVTVRDEPARRQTPARDWKGHVPPGSRFTLGDLQRSSEPRMLSAEAPLRIAIRATPDARFLARAHSVTLSLAPLPSLLETREASLEVAWNGVRLASTPVTALKQGAFSFSVKLPPSLLRPENELTLAWRGGPESARGPLAALGPETAFYLPRAFAATLPDLALLQSGLYPLSLRADLSELILVAPDGPREALVPPLCELGALLGRLAPADRLAFRVRQRETLSAAERESAHLLVLEAGGPALVPAPLLDWQRLPSGSELRKLPMLQELVSPWNPRRFVLRLASKDVDGLARGLRRLGDAGVIAHLMGDTAFLGSEAPVCYMVGTQREFEEISYATWVDAWLQSHWLALPLIVAAVSGGVYLALRAALRQYRAVHLAGSKG